MRIMLSGDILRKSYMLGSLRVKVYSITQKCRQYFKGFAGFVHIYSKLELDVI